eukprot:Gb_28464 [translate_table: standard]
MAIQSKNKTPKLEFKSEDEAWYDVSLQLRGSYLRIHYEEFPDDQDEMIPLEKFESREDVNSRFRFSSVQLQDQHCWKVKEGMAICASCSSDGEDNKFFDAVVEEIYKSKHLLVDGEQQCTCTFEVLWLAGPNATKRTTVSCENICLLTIGSIETHPVISAFVKLVEGKLDSRMRSVGRNPLRRKVANMEAECLAGSFTTNYRKQGKLGQMTSEGVSIEGSSIANSRDKLGETAQKANEDASTSDLHNNSLSLKDDRFKNLKEPCKQRSRAIETTRSRVDEALLSNPKEVADKSLAPEVDQTPHSGSITSQSQESQKKTEQGVNTTLKIIMGSEVLLQDLVTTDNDHKNLVQGGSDIGSETPTSSYPHKDTGLSLPEQLVRYTKMKGCEGRADACEKDSFCLGPSLSSGNMNIQEESIPESRIEADAAIILRKCDKTRINLMRKEQKPILDLNSAPLDLETIHTGVGICSNIPSNTFYKRSYPHSGNNLYTEDKELGELDNGVEIAEDVRPCYGGWLEMEGGDMFGKESSRDKVAHDSVSCKSGCQTAEMHLTQRNKGNKHPEEQSPYACGSIKRPSSCLGMEKWDEGYYHERSSKEFPTESGEFKEIIRDNGRKKVFLASCWGKGKRQKHTGNDIVVGERQLRENRQNGECTQALGKIIQPGTDSDGIYTSRSRSLTTLPLRPCNRKEPLGISTDMCALPYQSSMKVNSIRKGVSKQKEPIKEIRSNEIQSLTVPVEAVNMLSDEENGHDVQDSGQGKKYDCKINYVSRQQNNHYVKLQEGLLTTFDPKEGNCDSLQRSNSNIEEDQPKCTSKCEGYKNISSVGHRGNGENRELLDDAIQPSNDSAGVDALGSSCLTTSHGKPNKRKKLSISSPDLCDLPDQILEKGDEIGQGVTNHKWPVKQFRSIEMQSLKVPLEAMDVSSDNENGHTVKDSGTSEKYDYNSKYSSRQHSNCDVQLQEALLITVDGMDNCDSVQRNNCRSREDCPNFLSKSEVCKNVPTMQNQGNDHPVPELSNCCQSILPSSDYSDAADTASLHCTDDLDRFHCHSSVNECKMASLLCCSRPRESHISFKGSKKCNPPGRYSCKESSCLNGHCECSSQCFPSGCIDWYEQLDTCACGGFSDNPFCKKCQSKCHGDRCVHSRVYDTSSSSEDESTVDGELKGHCYVSNCKHRMKFRHKRANIRRAQRDILDQGKCNCLGKGLEDVCLEAEHGHDSEDLRKDQQFSSSQVLVLDNLEKDVTSSDVMKIISRVTCGVAQVYILPSLKFEQFTRGFICFEDRTSLEKASAFLQQDNLFIVSPNGRPWVMLDADNEGFKGTFGGFTVGPKGMRSSGTRASSCKITIVYKGTREYEKAKYRRNIFLELREHFALLHKRLGHEENNCCQREPILY